MKKNPSLPSAGDFQALITAVTSYQQLEEECSKLHRQMHNEQSKLRERIQVELGETPDPYWSFKDVLAFYREKGTTAEIERWLAEFAVLKQECVKSADAAEAVKPDRAKISHLCAAIKSSKMAEHETLVGRVVELLLPFCDGDPDVARDFGASTPAAIALFQLASACDPILDAGSISVRPLNACLRAIAQLPSQ